MESGIHNDAKLRRIHQFWNRKPVERPLLGFQLGHNQGGFWLKTTGRRFAGEHVLTPDMIHPEESLEWYEAVYQTTLQIEQDVFWTTGPCPEIPWIDAMFGCPIVVSESELSSKPYIMKNFLASQTA